MVFALLGVPGGPVYASTAVGPTWDRLAVDWGSIGGRFRTDFVIFYVYIRILTYLGPSLDLFGSGLGP